MSVETHHAVVLSENRSKNSAINLAKENFPDKKVYYRFDADRHIIVSIDGINNAELQNVQTLADSKFGSDKVKIEKNA